MTTVTLTFGNPHNPARYPPYNDTSHLIAAWLIRQAHAMLTKEAGNDALIFIINGEAVHFPQKINYSPQLANDLAKLVGDYAQIEVQ